MSKKTLSFVALAPNPHAAFRLVCLHHAGGSAITFRGWEQQLDPRCELWSLQLPGRGRRYSEPLIREPNRLISLLEEEFMPWIDKPYILFGHSMGALLAYELACAVERSRARAPVHLLLCGRRAPHQPSPHAPMHQLPDAELIEKVRSLDGTDEEILEHPELIELLLPILRADFQIAETHSNSIGPPLKCPISVFTGSRDPWVSEEAARAWQDLTTGPFTYKQYDGGHFLTSEQRQLIVGEVNDILNRFFGSSPNASDISTLSEQPRHFGS